jgi:hypothetical protein
MKTKKANRPVEEIVYTLEVGSYNGRFSITGNRAIIKSAFDQLKSRGLKRLRLEYLGLKLKKT